MSDIQISAWELWPTSVSFIELCGHQVAAHNAALEKIVIEGCAAQHGQSHEKRLHKLHQVHSNAIDWLINHIQSACAQYAQIENPQTIKVGLRGVLLLEYDHISTHNEASESDLGVAYWPSGDAKKMGTPINQQADGINEPIFKFEDPSRSLADFRLPFEMRHSIDVCPRPGLLAIYPTHLPHNVHPYKGKKPFVQIVAQVRLPSNTHITKEQ